MTDLLTLTASHAGAPWTQLAIGDRAGALSGLLRPFAQRPHVFVTDGEAATTVTIHKDANLDLELAIATGELRWTVAARDVATGRVLLCDTRCYRDGRPLAAARDAMANELSAFLTVAVDARVRQHARCLEAVARDGSRQLLPLGASRRSTHPA